MSLSGVTQQSKFNKWLRITARQLMLQTVLILIGLTVIFPILWIVTLSTDARGLPQYSELNIVPQPGRISFHSFEKLLFEPFETLSSASNEIYFTQLLSNSLFVALGTAMLSVGLGATAAYAFSRFKFVGRQAGMLGFIVLLMMPATGTIVPLIAIFSLLRVHVVFSILAPSLFYGVLMALVSFGLVSGLKSFMKRGIFDDNTLRYVAFAVALLFTFSLVYFGVILHFRSSDVYDTAIRLPLRATNSFQEDILAAQTDIPKEQDNIARQQRRLEDARNNLALSNDTFESIEADFPGVYELANGLEQLGLALSHGLTGTQASLIERIYIVDDPRAIINAGIQSDIAKQEVLVEEAKQDLADVEASLETSRQALDEARAPITELRNKAMLRLLPFTLGVYVFCLILAGLLFVVSGLYQLHVGSLARRDRLSNSLRLGYAVIALIIAFSWFDSNYKSPTQEVGLDNGGLWYDIRMSFRDEDDIATELEPYLERADYQASLLEMQGKGLEEFRAERQDDLAQINTLIAQMEVFAVNKTPTSSFAVLSCGVFGLSCLNDPALTPPSNMTRQEKIDWKDSHREFIRNGGTENIRFSIDQKQALLDGLTLETQDGNVVVTGVVDGSLADDRWIRVGDIIINVSSTTVNSVESFEQTLNRNIGENFTVNIDHAANLRAFQSASEPFVGRTTTLNLLNNENFKGELLDRLRDRQDEIDRELEITNAASLEEAEANFTALINRLPDNAEEQERLQKELAIRSSNDNNVTETMKITLFGLMIAYSSGALPFAIWNLKGYFDTIPKELEEAALVDGANMAGTFFRIILPLSVPALAITTLFGFMTGWTEFILAVQFLTAGDVDRTTLAMALRGIAGGGVTQAEPNYTDFAAMSILMAIPVVSLFYIFQRWIVSGLTVGGVKG